MLIQTLIDHLNTRIPLRYQEDWDNSGFLVGDPRMECSGILVALDLTPEVIDEAVALGYNFIVTHHPILRNGIKRITPSTAEGRLVLSLIQHGLCHYAAHTSLDNHPQGVSDILARKLGLTDCRILRPAMIDDVVTGGGMIGQLPVPMPLTDFISRVKEVLAIPCVRTSAPCNTTIHKVALCGGSGAFMIDDAKAYGADIYLTGDLKYHDFQQAEGKIVLAEIGHYESEQFAKELLLTILQEKHVPLQETTTRGGYIFYN